MVVFGNFGKYYQFCSILNEGLHDFCLESHSKLLYFKCKKVYTSLKKFRKKNDWNQSNFLRSIASKLPFHDIYRRTLENRRRRRRRRRRSRVLLEVQSDLVIHWLFRALTIENILWVFIVESLEVDKNQVHLSQRLKRAFPIKVCPLSIIVDVVIFVVVNFSHLRLLLQNDWANLNHTCNTAVSDNENSIFV